MDSPPKGTDRDAQGAVGPVLPPGMDGRSRWAKRFRRLVSRHARDLGRDPSAAEDALIRRIAALSVEMERLELEFAKGDASAEALASYGTLAAHQKRLLDSLAPGPLRAGKDPQKTEREAEGALNRLLAKLAEYVDRKRPEPKMLPHLPQDGGPND